MGEGCIMFSAAVGKLALQHLLSDRQQLRAGHVMEVSGLKHPLRSLTEPGLFGRRCRHVAQCGMCDTLGVVHHRYGVAVEVAVG